MENGKISIETRRSLLFYLLNRLGLAIDEVPLNELQKKQHIVILNKEEIKNLLKK